LITHLTDHIISHTLQISQATKIDAVVALDARGFLLGPIIALRLGAAFVPVRKAGKLPGKCINATYEKEYGTVSCPFYLSSTLWLLIEDSQDSFEMQVGAIKPGQNVVVIDDLLATGMQTERLSVHVQHTNRLGTGGSAKAAGELVTNQGGKTLEYLFIIELLFLKGSSKLDGPVYSVVQADD
jgi:adenine phosphoribosyltransferase